ncbi:dipeptidase 1-like [Mizuhopecten yessoensis]|uniref:Dipeptidase n=1 Tax=Mizuhopecten yessoensis TaxID=6573 RepID=A0A210PZ55_MIZYE|nr:dipeptidase 1-like [Mizuhopecten yessoensis]OWF41763.1 Dipeptidase 1 [Mizuhopecten yessoensis]
MTESLWTRYRCVLILAVLFLIGAFAVILGVALGVIANQIDDTHEGVVQRVLEEYPLIDAHNDLPWTIRQKTKNKVYSFDFYADTRQLWPMTINLTDPSFSYMPPCTDIPRLRKGKVGAQFWSIFTSCESSGKDAVRMGLDQVDVVYKFVRRYSDVFELVRTADGLLDAFRRNKIASAIGLEGGHMIGNTLGVLRMHYELGTRYMTLTHSCDTDWADSYLVDVNETSTRGLTDFGKIVVKEMNRLGMMVDLSHVSHQTMIDAILTSEAPIIFSHSNVFTLCNHYRNVQDDVIDMTKENGGIIMVNFYNGYLNCDPNQQQNTTIQTVADHLDYIKDRIGADFVGLGADFDGVELYPIDLDDTSKYPNLLLELRRRGWTEVELRKVVGENFIRVFRAVERVRDNLRDQPPYEDIIAREDIQVAECTTNI